MTAGIRQGSAPRPLQTNVCTLVAILVIALAGCSTQAPRPQVFTPALPDRPPCPELEKLPPLRPVAVVLSADSLTYRAVADALGDGAWTFYVLDGRNDAEVLAGIRRAQHARAIAIGRQALDLLAPTGLAVAYCQVLDPPAASGSVRGGVAPLPDFGAQLDAWLARQPSLRRIGVITGPAYRDAAGRLETAAGARQLGVSRAVVRTDKEMLYVFRRMVPDIQGFLLYPDTSILSPAAIRELLAYARKHGVQVLTYNRAVYQRGAAMLVSADPAEVARQVTAVLQNDATTPVEAGLSQVVIEVAHPEPGHG